MPPKRPYRGVDESPSKRARSNQSNIDSFFGAAESSPRIAKVGNASLRQPEIIVIDDEDDDVNVPIESSEIMPAEHVPLGHPVEVDGLLEFGLSSSLLSVGSKPPVRPNVSSDDTILLSSARGAYSNSPRLLGPRVMNPGPSRSAALSNFPTLSVDPLLFDPCADSNPWWTEGTGAPYALLVHALQTLTSTRSRIAILSILTNVLRILIVHDPESVLPALYLLSNSLSPAWQGIELGVGASIISKTLQTTTSITPKAIRTLHTRYGDPGDVAYHAVIDTSSGARTSVLRPHPPLLIQSLYRDLHKIASAKGQGSQKTRQAITDKLMLSAVGSSWTTTGKTDLAANRNAHLLGEEARYLVRTLAQNLRVGAVRTTILNALAKAFVLSPPPAVLSLPADDRTLSISSDDLRCIASQKQDQSPLSPVRKGKAKIGQSEAYKEAHERVQATLKRAEALLRQAYAQHPSYDDLVAALLRGGIDTVIEPTHPIGLTIGVPLMPALGEPTRSLDEIYERLGPHALWTAEMKYDGQRAQVHAWRAGDHVNVKIYSRHLETMTDKYPDLVHLIVETFRSDLSLQSFIVDAEVVAIDPRNGELRSFQELAGRARKDVKASDVKVAVCLFLFDMMYLNGASLIQQPFRERRRLLRSNLPPVRQFASSDDASSLKVVQASLDHVESVEAHHGREVVEEFWERAVESKCEGLMIKLLDTVEVVVDTEAEMVSDEESDQSAAKKGKRPLGKGSRRKALPATYEPDKRTSAWLKLKKDYVEGVSDSLDLVPIGAWHGNGRKAAWWSPVLMAVYDPERGVFVALCKCMSGFTDAFYEELNNRYVEGSNTCSTSSQWNIETGGYRPSVYFKPMEVWEMKGADLTISPTSVTARGMMPELRDKGLSLRFPRFIRIREDKSVEITSTPAFVVRLWLSQERKGQSAVMGGVDEGDLIDYVEEEIEGEYESSEHADA